MSPQHTEVNPWMNSERRWCLDSTGWSERRKRAWKHTDNIAVTFSVGHSARLVVRLPLPLYPQTTTVKQFIHWTACWSSQRSCRLYTEVKETRNYKKAAKRQPGIVRVIRSAHLETSQNKGVKMPQPDPNTSLCVLSYLCNICCIQSCDCRDTYTVCAKMCVVHAWIFTQSKMPSFIFIPFAWGEREQRALYSTLMHIRHRPIL